MKRDANNDFAGGTLFDLSADSEATVIDVAQPVSDGGAAERAAEAAAREQAAREAAAREAAEREAAARAQAAREGAKPKVLSVSQALQIAKGQLEAVRVSIEGEVSEFSDKPGYKAVYFTITDSNCALPCLIWKNDFSRSGLQLRKGMLVQISGSFSLYAAKGRMNFVARSIKMAGEGDLRMKVAELARKLQAEGLMAPERKKPIPQLATKIAVVTSPRGKAVHDVLRTLRRRSPQVEVYVAGVPVEGDGAPDAIVHGLQVADASDCEIILLVRGGGSYEDLMPFNDERVARAVAACRKPVVTGIGHEPDNSIADMVGDLRCSTPTAAAEASAADIRQIDAVLQQNSQRMSNALVSRVQQGKATLAHYASRPVFTDPNFLLSGYAMRLDVDADQLARALPGMISSHRAALGLASQRLTAAIPNAIAANRGALERARTSMQGIGSHLLDASRASLAVSAARLEDLSPLSILSRGYAIAYDEGGHVVASVQDVQEKDNISVQVGDGRLACTVEQISQEDIRNGGNDE
ncbi:MAG: exodeoxyribonuclease VII large subunit [Coriobacteriales bacterium]|jgi:exodeoxyribonuclease VII large subunit